MAHHVHNGSAAGYGWMANAARSRDRAQEFNVRQFMGDPRGIDPPAGDVAEREVVLRLPASEVARAGLVLIGLGVAFYLLWSIHEVIFLFLLAILLATAIEPLVNFLRRGPFGRESGVLVVYTTIVLAIAVPSLFLAP